MTGIRSIGTHPPILRIQQIDWTTPHRSKNNLEKTERSSITTCIGGILGEINIGTGCVNIRVGGEVSERISIPMPISSISLPTERRNLLLGLESDKLGFSGDLSSAPGLLLPLGTTAIPKLDRIKDSQQTGNVRHGREFDTLKQGSQLGSKREFETNTEIVRCQGPSHLEKHSDLESDADEDDGGEIYEL
ncbi:hypothetical protein K435DRAFT_874906 [Dendrothele bispora CBS 962.96]|uniref:Uncharacterized protein n=1 Tax=Dendrothele bispora (strain CBS 962.96) TaxID=1314807 RepID=A0A4S8KVK3_DENBC|nr:hypothetical protein K435DRAFT_874906 [Dendrothele bispora CBS 962.96]